LSNEGKDGGIFLNGAALRLVNKDDLIIIARNAQLDEKEIIFFKPNIVFLNE
jgi:aspartate 1-decarboxylase